METYLACLIKACQEIGLDYQFLDKEHNLIRIYAGSDPLYFQINKTPFNSAVMSGICIDKEHSYILFRNSINMPKTIGFLDYDVAAQYQKYLCYKSINEIIDKIEKEFNYPVVIKKNKGGLGINVFLCRDREQVQGSLKTIYNKNCSEYDYVALAQEYLPYQQEFRLVCFRGEAVLAYERVSGNSKFNLRYWESDSGMANHITDQKTIDDLVSFVSPAFGIKGLEYVGFDILKRKDGKYYLLELNSGPKYDHFIKCNGEEAVVAMYKRIMSRILDEAE